MAEVKKSKRFNYKLAAVLKVREIRENQQKDKFAEAERKHKQEIEKEQRLKQLLTDKYSELRDLMASGSIENMNDIMMRKAHLESVKGKITEQVKVREEAEKIKEEEREKLIQTVKDRKIIEKDKGKKRVSWRKVMDKEEGKFLDDISTVGYVKKKRESAENAGENT